jgi:hypothetical protein
MTEFGKCFRIPPPLVPPIIPAKILNTTVPPGNDASFGAGITEAMRVGMITTTFPHSSLLRRLAAGIVVWAFLTTAAEARSIKPMTGRTLDRLAIAHTLPMAKMGDVLYAEVNSEWLKDFYQSYRSELSRMGVVKWDDRYDCRRFAGLFTELAQTRFFKQAFHSGIPANTLALGPVWYRRADGKGGHAIVVALTERGAIYLDPQNGKEVDLTAAERASIHLAVL